MRLWKEEAKKGRKENIKKKRKEKEERRERKREQCSGPFFYEMALFQTII